MSANVLYDISIWEGIRSTVKYKTETLIGDLHREIPRDPALSEYHGKQPVPWQLQEVMQQRGHSWVQRVYDLCCEARKDTTSAPSHDFDRAVWAYCIEPFIMGDTPSTNERYSTSSLLDLLFTAVGSPYEKRDCLTASQRHSCLAVRRTINDNWYHKLHHRPSGLDEAVAAVSRYNALERRAQRMVAGLPPEPPPPSNPGSKSGQTDPPKGFGLTAATWDAIEISFISDERVQICSGRETVTLNYREFGFEDTRSGKPNAAWATLRQMVRMNGTIRDPGNTGKTWSVVEKQVQNIRKIFRALFGIAGDPIPFVPEVAYRACFKLGCSRSFDT